MKILLEHWRSFLLEERTEYQGILKVGLGPMALSKAEALQSMLPEKAQRLDPEDLHVTLIHQSILKPLQKQLEKLDLPAAPSVALEDKVWERESLGKKSWAVRVKNQDKMREYVKNIMALLGSENTSPEPERVFHVSLANLTGNPHDSVR